MTTIVEQPQTSGFGSISPCSNTFVSLTQEARPSDAGWSSIRTSLDVSRQDIMMDDPSKESEVAGQQISQPEASSTPAPSESEPSRVDADEPQSPAEPTMSATETQPDTIDFELPPETMSRRPSAVPEAFVSMLHDIDAINESRWTMSKEETIRGPYDYISSAPGKEFRTQLIGGLNLWHKVPKESLEVIAKVVRMLHNASLLIDDIQDNSTLRRGRPVAHSVYGVAQTINSANFVYFLALAELQKLRNPKQAVDVFTQEMLALHRGQGMDLYWRDTLSCPTEADYLEMVSNKTGGLFRLAVRLMQTESDMGIDCMPLINIMGLIFQIADDYKNLADKDYTESKGYCEDLTEGKFSFPVIHSIHSSSGNQVLLNILSQKPTAFEVKRHAVEHMESTGSLEYTRQFVEALSAKARELAVQLDLQCGINSNVTLSLVEKMARI